MKEKDLKILKNKMVHYQSEMYDLKGFLERDSYSGYYILITESTQDNHSKNDRFLLTEERLEDGTIVHFDPKPKLMRVSKNSWHYRLVKYVLGKNAPTPKTMRNGCPFFWLLVFSMFVAPFKFFFKTIVGVPLVYVGKKFLAGVHLVGDAIFKSWVGSFSEEKLFDIYDDPYENAPSNVFFTSLYKNIYGVDFTDYNHRDTKRLIEEWVRKNKNIDPDVDTEEFEKLLSEFRTKKIEITEYCFTTIKPFNFIKEKSLF